MNASESLNSRSMKSLFQDIVVGNKSCSRATTMHGSYDQQIRKMPMKSLLGSSSEADEYSAVRVAQSNKLVISRGNNQGRQPSSSPTFANGFKEHVKGKLSLGAKLLRVGSMDKMFKHMFSVRASEGEQLLKASQCCLSTTAGPIAGLLFVSTHKLAFCSHSSIVKLSSPTGKLLKFHYKVVIPLRKIERAKQRESMKKTSKKYLQLNTTDEFEFWFMGFRNYNKMFHCLQHAISQALDFSHDV